MSTVLKFYLVENNEIVMFDYDTLSNNTLNLIDTYANECRCKRTDNIINGQPSDIMDLLVILSKIYNILLT